jgi:hypothetical protein
MTERLVAGITTQLLAKVSVSNLGKFCGMVYGLHGKVHLQLYVN